MNLREFHLGMKNLMSEYYRSMQRNAVMRAITIANKGSGILAWDGTGKRNGTFRLYS